MKIKVLGSGCKNCQNLEKNVKEALNKVMIDQFVVPNPELYENLKQKYIWRKKK